MDWMDVNYADAQCEAHYALITPRIILEQRIGAVGEVLIDYKFHVFRQRDGGARTILQVVSGRFDGPLQRAFYEDDYSNPISGSHVIELADTALIIEARRLSEKLLGDLPYARIDWYVSAGRLYFGEITITPAAGCGAGYGRELDLEMGAMWIVSDSLYSDQQLAGCAAMSQEL